MKRFFAFALLLALPLQLVAAEPSVSTDTSWVSDLEAPVEYTHVRDGYVLDISYEAYFNRYRERLGVPRLKVSNDLQESAAAHAAYLAANGVGWDPHGETEGLTGFTGETIQDRCTAAGYGGYCTEVQAGGSSDGDGYSAIDALMMTPYHRAAMMYPYVTEVGCAIDSGYFVCDLGLNYGISPNDYPEHQDYLTYPYDGQVISTTFYVSENPMPYPEYAYDFIGPTLMYWPFEGYDYLEIHSAEVSLYDLTAGEAIPNIVRLDLDDSNTFGGIFFNPIEPLELDHEYAARVTGESEHGTFDHSWTFKTQSSSKIDFPNGWENITYDASVHWAGDSSTQSVSTPDAEVRSLIDRLEGWIMLAVDRAGEAYYVDPVTKARYYLRDGPTAYEFLRTFGLGITTANLETIPEAGSGAAVTSTARSLAGRILLQVDSVGEAWYVHPETYERHYMADGDEAYRIMRELSEGTMYDWISDIPEGIVQ
jgi:hypothetical protein